MSESARSRLGRRLEKLEATVPGHSWDITAVIELALTKLSPADREVLQDDDARRRVYLSEGHRDVWARWEEAFAEAVDERRFLVRLTAADLFL